MTSGWSHTPRWHASVLSLAVFLIPAFSLALPTGYSWGAALLVLLGLLAWPQVLRHPHTLPTELRWWALATLGMGLVWTLHTYVDGQWLMRTLGIERSLKYLLLLLALPALRWGLPRLEALRWGCWVGALGAGLLAAWQWLVLHWDRAAGHTNAIQFGNLALLLGLWSWVWARHAPSRAQALLGYAAALAGLFACVASGSRGGWIVAPALVLLVWVLDVRDRRTTWRERLPRLARAGAVGVVLCGMLAWLPPVQERLAEATREYHAWHDQGRSETSVGQRLAHWGVAWELGLQKPWLGWGQVAYDAQKQALIETGQAPQAVADFNHAHHEWIDMFAKRGLVGVLALAAFFAIPAWRYARALRRAPPGQPYGPTEQAALCGLVGVLGFVGFGMTQVMFAHNNAHMMFLFMNLLWLAVMARPSPSQAPCALAPGHR